MKKTLRFALLFCSLLGFGLTKAQVCTVDPQYTSPGIYPSDTLQDMWEAQATNQVVQFVFPEDTVVFGFTLPFDSFKVSSVSNVPPGLLWECNQNHPVCTYVTTPGQLTRGCVKVYGTPTGPSAALPSYDSLIVTGTAYVTLFGSVQSFASDIPVYYRVYPAVSAAEAIGKAVNLQVQPNPVNTQTWVSFQLSTPSDVKVSLYNVLGEEVKVVSNGPMTAGDKNVSLDMSELDGGIYFVRLNLNNGEYVGTQKVVSLR